FSTISNSWASIPVPSPWSTTARSSSGPHLHWPRCAKAIGSRSCAWSAAGLFDAATFLDGSLGLGPLVPRLGPARAPQRPFVSLAGEQHRVAGLRELDRAADRRATVDHDLVITPRRFPGG